MTENFGNIFSNKTPFNLNITSEKDHIVTKYISNSVQNLEIDQESGSIR